MYALKLLRKILSRAGYEVQKKSPNAFFEQKRLLSGVEKPIIFDVGAHHGQTARHYYSLLDNSTIYSFEPFPESFSELVENTQKYQNIKAYNLALSNKDGKIKFHSNILEYTNSILETDFRSAHTWETDLIKTQKVIEVDTITLDSFVEKNQIPKIDLLKLDTQGSEFMIIEGAKQSIKSNKIKLIYTEIITMPTYQGQKDFDEVLNIFKINNFTLYNLFNFSIIEGQLRQVDAIFVNNDFQYLKSK